MQDKIKGGLIGLAIGDAMGVATEFMTPEEIEAKYGRVTEILGGGVFGFQRGETSDDTAMTVAVAKGIIANSNDPIEEIGKEFLKWRESKPKDIGITIQRVFQNYQGDWHEAAEHTHFQLNERSGGNGSLMRCLPISFAYSDRAKVDELSVGHSKMTHFDDDAAEACVIYNRVARRLLNGENLACSILAEIKDTKYDLDYRQKPECPADGYVVNSLKWVFYWLLNGKTFDEVVVGAVNMGDDSDTIAAIAGGLKGIEVGYHALPWKHKRKLVDLTYLEELGNVLSEIRDKDTLVVKGNQQQYLEELGRATESLLAEDGLPLANPDETISVLRENVYLYRASLREELDDFYKKYRKWRNVEVRFRRSRRLLELGAPVIIIQHELTWLRTELQHLEQIHQGIEPEYTSEQKEELEELARMERALEEEEEEEEVGQIE